MNAQKEPPFNEEFCTNLEYKLSQAFEKSNQEDLIRFWCDGISHEAISPYQLSKKSVNDSRKIITKAWLGLDGQDIYEMTILFGKYSLRRYAKGSSLLDCIPDEHFSKWVSIDDNKKL